MNVEKPLLTKSLTSACLFGVGDLSTQAILRKDDENHDWARTGRQVVFGGAIFAPLAHGWYILLEAQMAKTGLTGAKEVVSKIAADQLIFTPPINVVFFTASSMMEGKGPGESYQQAVDKLWPTLKVNWTVWPLIHTVTFSVIPFEFRILWINVCAMGWSGFLSFMANTKQKDEATALTS